MFTSIFNFFDKLFHWDSDQGTFTKILSILLALFGLFCLGWLVIASYGIGHTQLAMAHKAGHGGSETLFATLFFAGAAFWGWLNFTDRVKFQVNQMLFIVSLLVLIILGVNANTGFFGHVY